MDERIVENSNQIITKFGEKIKGHDEQFNTIAIIGKKDTTDDVKKLQSLIEKSLEKCTKLVIKDEFIINDFIEIPSNLNIEFDGGFFNVSEFDLVTQTGGWVYFNNPKYSLKPEWFGAKGDGVTDDTKAIQNCIDAGLNPKIFPIGKTQNEVGKQHSNYNSICVDFSNNYKVSNSIVVRAEYHFNKLTLTSSSNKATINGYLTNSTYVDKCFIIKKPDDYPQGDVDYQTRKTIEKLTIKGFNYGIYNEGADLECRILNNNFQDINTSAIYLKTCDGTLVSGNYGSWVYGYLVELYYSNGCKIVNNHIGETSEVGTKGIKIESGSGVGNLIEGNYFRKASVNINNRLNNFDKIVNNTFYYSDEAIIISDISKGVTIENNNFISCITGTTLYKEHILKSNNFYKCGIGVYLKSLGLYNQLITNNFKDCTVAIKHGTSSNNQVVSNMFINGQAIDSDNFGYNMFLSDNSFLNCSVVHNFTTTTTQNFAKFGYNYSTQKGLVFGSELN